MDWLDAVKEIKNAQENNRLVIFVGSGVSNNSGVPTWHSLIQTFAEEIQYNRDDDTEPFTQEELLRIPEYFYRIKGPEEYYRLIHDTLSTESGPNAIDDEIFRIMPHHIITTNFDSLLEDSSAVNSRLYTVVSKDKDLLSNAMDRYLIKMHGDLKETKSLVLKEGDYITYEQNYPMISTFIRALLVNHTFLFLGYSLNDNNLNLIIGWINYFCEVLGIENRPTNFLVTSKSPSDFERIRLENKHIVVIDLPSLPKTLIDNIDMPDSLVAPKGKKLFAFLRCLTDTELLQHYMPVEDMWAEKCTLLQSYKVISIKDMKETLSLKQAIFEGTTMVLLKQNIYANLKSQIDSQKLNDVFERTILTQIRYGDEMFSLEPDKTETDDIYFQLYLDNDYIELDDKLKSCTETDTKIYYYHFLGKTTQEIQELLDLEESSVLNGDFVAILLHKMRDRFATITAVDGQKEKMDELRYLFNTVPGKYEPAIGFLRMMFASDAQDKYVMDQIVEKQEKIYSYNSSTHYYGTEFKYILDIQSYAYDYYFFVKGNRLPVDYFSSMSEYLYYYVRVILCSYAPTYSNEDDNNPFFQFPPLRHYTLNEIDFDIVVKYIKPLELKKLLENYTVPMLEIDDNVNVCCKYENLCKSFLEYQKGPWRAHISNFNMILCYLEMENEDKKALFDAFIKMLEGLSDTNPSEISELFDTLDYLVRNLSLDNADSEKQKLLTLLTDEPVYSEIIKKDEVHFRRIVKKLSDYVTTDIQEKISTSMECTDGIQTKTNKIILFRYLLPMDSYRNFLAENIKHIKLRDIFELLADKQLDFNEDIYQIFIDKIEDEVQRRENNPGVRTFPDWLSTSLEYCMILKLVGINIDLTRLEPYKEYSVQLQFMLDPDTFDYSLVDTGNYMWQNLFINETYRKYFVQHKQELLSEELKNIFDRKVDTREQQKIVYGILLDDTELFDF